MTTQATHDELEALRCTVSELTAQLETANLRVEAALDVIPLIYRVVEDHHSRMVVITDIVDCWLSLDPAVRKEYERQRARNAPVGRFGADYVDAVTQGVPESPPTLDCLQWLIHTATAQKRRILGEPPSSEWLGRFPMAET
jgi:hypothetical protein